jgi:hypothetical protein
MKTKLALLTASATLLLLGAGCNSPSTTENTPTKPAQVQNTVVNTLVGNDYQNAVFNYKVSYPKDWNVSETTADGATIIPNKKTHSGAVSIITGVMVVDEVSSGIFDFVKPDCEGFSAGGLRWCYYHELINGNRTDLYVANDGKNFLGTSFHVDKTQENPEAEILDFEKIFKQVAASWRSN